MKEILYSEMNSLGSIVDSLMQDSAIKKGIKKATLFKFWNQVSGKKFENVSEVVSLFNKNGKTVLNIACASSSVTAELMMFKPQILKKFNKFANPLGIEIEDINFSHKLWKNAVSSNNKTFEIEPENPYKEDLTGFKPEEIQISDEDMYTIKENIYANKALTVRQKERVFNSIINDLKVQKFKLGKK